MRPTAGRQEGLLIEIYDKFFEGSRERAWAYRQRKQTWNLCDCGMKNVRKGAS